VIGPAEEVGVVGGEVPVGAEMTAVPLSEYRSSLSGPPQYSFALPVHTMLHPFTLGSELV
jgi:hypothetical protein